MRHGAQCGRLSDVARQQICSTSTRKCSESPPLPLCTGWVDQAVDKPCAEAAGPGPSRPAVNRVFIERYQAVNRSDHAQILCTRLCISCDQSAPAPAGTGLAAAGRETARRGGAATYPPATAGARLRRGGLCTDAVEQTVHRLFGPGCSPGRARPSGNRAKIDQNQLDRRCLCTNAVRRSVHSLWAGGARPGPAGPGPGRALFAQSSGRTWSSRGDAWLLPATAAQARRHAGSSRANNAAPPSAHQATPQGIASRALWLRALI